MLRLGRLVAVLALSGAACLFGAGSASATALPIGQCTPTAGVILAVDFSSFGGPVLRSCGSTPTSGYTLLNQGGWHTDGTQHDGPAFVCRIGYSGFSGGTRYPTNYNCVNTPPTSAYWSYWHADAGKNVWSYSQSGAMGTSPAAGSVDAWVFGAGGAPPFSPDSVRNASTLPPGGGSSGGGQTGGGSSGGGQTGGGSSGGGSSGGGQTGGGQASSGGGQTGGGSSGGQTGGGASGGGSPAGGAAGAPSGNPAVGQSGNPARGRSSESGTTARATSTGAGSARSTPGAGGSSGGKSGAASSSASGTPTPATSSRGSTAVDAQPTADSRRSTGSYVPELVAAGILVLLAGLTGLTFWRRKQAGQQL